MAVKILLAGCGHLGQALLRRWVVALPRYDFIIVKPSPLPDDLAACGHVAWHPQLSGITAQPDAIIYAVRPQQLAAVLPDYAALAEGCVNISVDAGWRMEKFAQYLGDAALVRTMPNVPAQIGQGMTPMAANAACAAPGKALAESLFAAVGEAVWLDREDLLDAATALSGSGPAYVYLLTTAMTEAGITLGLPPAVAAQLARATVRGAANYMAQSGEDTAALWQAMLLPGGTTEAALTRLLDKDGLRPLMESAMRKAADRAKAIGDLA